MRLWYCVGSCAMVMMAVGCESDAAAMSSDAGDPDLACFTDLGVPLPLVEDPPAYYATPEAEIASAQAQCQVHLGTGAELCLGEPLLTRNEALCATLRAGGVPGEARCSLVLAYEPDKMRLVWRVSNAKQYRILVLDGHTGALLEDVYAGPTFP